MGNYSNNQRRKKHCRNQRAGLKALIGVLVAILAVLVLALLLFKGPKIELYSEVEMEAGDNFPSPQSFLAKKTDKQIYYSNTSAVLTNVPGVYEVVLVCDGEEYKSTIRVKDTIAPMATVKNLSAWAHEMPEAKDFVVTMQDHTEVTVSYVTQPDITKDGPQTVTIRLTDAAGNTTDLQATLTLTTDREAPVITGVNDKVVYLGDAVSYMNGVTVTDNADTDPKLDVDRSSVDLTAVGEYTVTYTATDAAGNTSVVSMKLKVLEKKDYYVDYEVIYEEVDAILAEIIRDDMTVQSKVWAVYIWIRTNCSYVSHSDKEDWMQAAHVMMTERKGDCFNYYALCKLMLDRLEIPNLDVRKVKNYETDNDHYWSLVSVDGGNTWYHVDTTPRTNPASFCLVTDKYMDDYSAANGKCFNRDKSLYPATPEEEL